MQQWRNWIPISALVLVLVAGVGHTGSDPYSTESTEPNASQQRDCGPAALPDSLPAASQIIDVDRVLSQLAEQYPGVGDPLFAVRYEANGQPAAARVLDSPLRESVADSLGKIVTAHLYPQPAGPVWGVRLHLTHEPAPAIRVERSVYCPPESESGQFVLPFTIDGRGSGEVPPRPTAAMPLGFQAPKARVLVSSHGTAREVEIVQSSGNFERDRAFANGLRDARFKPALLDGVAIDAWYELGGR